MKHIALLSVALLSVASIAYAQPAASPPERQPAAIRTLTGMLHQCMDREANAVNAYNIEQDRIGELTAHIATLEKEKTDLTARLAEPSKSSDNPVK